jgi:hypothetical protein
MRSAAETRDASYALNRANAPLGAEWNADEGAALRMPPGRAARPLGGVAYG